MKLNKTREEARAKARAVACSEERAKARAVAESAEQKREREWMLKLLEPENTRY